MATLIPLARKLFWIVVLLAASWPALLYFIPLKNLDFEETRILQTAVILFAIFRQLIEVAVAFGVVYVHLFRSSLLMSICCVILLVLLHATLWKASALLQLEAPFFFDGIDRTFGYQKSNLIVKMIGLEEFCWMYSLALSCMICAYCVRSKSGVKFFPYVNSMPFFLVAFFFGVVAFLNLPGVMRAVL